MVRHGARAPTRSDTLRFGTGFAPGELTPNGMRQRYLLGRYNYQRYHQGLGDYSNIKDIYVQSTNVHRTLQSGYSELFGLQNQANQTVPQILPQQQTKQQIPFQVRNLSTQGVALKLNAAPEGFVNFPIYTYIDSELWNNNGPDFDNCNYVVSTYNLRAHNNSIYDAFEQVKTNLTAAMADSGFLNDKSEVLNSTYFTSLTYGEFEHYADKIFCERWNQVPQKHNWTKDDLHDLNVMLESVLVVPYTDYAKQLLVTKQMFEPMLQINEHESESYSHLPKYMLYSGHDDNIANHLLVYMPDYLFVSIPFAASIYFEVYDEFGVWYVQGQYNGVPVKLRGCGGHTRCQWKAFQKHMKDTLYTGDLKEACAASYMPPTAMRKKNEEDMSFLQIQ